MAVQIMKHRVCDICGSGEQVRTYRVGIVGDGRGVAPDLCGEHQEPLEMVMASARKGGTGLRKQPKVKSEAEVKKLRRRS